MNDATFNSITGAWHQEEVLLLIDDYFHMLNLELSGQSYNKSERRRLLQKVVRRTDGSIEMKRQNLSAVLDLLGLPYIEGYKPLSNFQQALVDGVENYLAIHGLPDMKNILQVGMAEQRPLLVGAPPQRLSKLPRLIADMGSLLRKFDPATRDARNRELGLKGEELVLESEISRLWNAGYKNFAKKVRHVAKEDGDGLGYDIHSYDEGGSDRLIEVKTTVGSIATPFFVTANERAVSIKRQKHYRLLRLYDFAKQPKAFELAPPLEEWVNLSPAVYQASFR